MSYRIYGIICIILGCGAVGFIFAYNAKREVTALKQFIAALEFMKCELQFSLPALSDLCRHTASVSTHHVRKLFNLISDELDNQIFPDAHRCILSAIKQCKDMPSLTQKAAELLATSIGHFDLKGQLSSIETVMVESQQLLATYSNNLETRSRCYKTLGICAGAAIAILLI